MKISAKNKKTRYNRYSKSAKYSEYKTLQLVECFARDLSIQETVRLTKMSERTVRDRFADIRGKLLGWSIDYPDRFNGFGHLLLDPMGTININVLELLFYYSQTDSFKQRMAKRYPRFRSEKDAALAHVLEMTIKRFTSVELPEANQNFFNFVQKIFSESKIETYLRSVKYKPPAFEARLQYWRAASKRISFQKEYCVRKFPNANGELLYRDLKYCLKRGPI